MQKEDFKKLMHKYFGYKKELHVVEENDEYIEMLVDMTLKGMPEPLIEKLCWRKDEIDFCKRLETKNVKLLGYYHRVSPQTNFDQRSFYFMVTDKLGETYPIQFSVYKQEDTILIKFSEDHFFPKNKKHDDNEEVLAEEREIVHVIKMYYTVKFVEEARQL